MRRVVVTGMGAITPLGVGVPLVWERLTAGQSGIRAIESFDVSDLPAKIAGLVPIGDAPGDFRATEFVEAKELRRNDTFIIYAIAAATEAMVFDRVKGMIVKAWDVTYSEYFRRGLEDLPVEAPAVFDWMDRRRRVPYLKNFAFSACRTCDNRFFGLVVSEFLPGRTTPPELVEPLGGDWTMLQNSHPFKKASAFEAEFQVPVAPGQEALLSYRVRVK